MDPEKLKVVDLRKELQQRGLDTKGVKAALVKRLKDALDAESSTPGSAPNVTSGVDENESEEEEPEESEEKQEVPPTPKKEPAKTLSPKKEPPSTPKKEALSPKKDVSPQKADQPPASDSAEKKPQQMDTETRGAKRKRGEDDEEEEEDDGREKKRRDDAESEETSENPEKTSEKTPAKERPPPREDEPEIDLEKALLSWFDSDLHLKIDKNSFLSAKPLNDGCFGYLWAGARATHGISSGKICFEVKITEELKWEDPADKMQERADRGSRDKFRVDRRREQKGKEEKKDGGEEKKEEKEETSEEKKEEHAENGNGVEKMETEVSTDESKEEEAKATEKEGEATVETEAKEAEEKKEESETQESEEKKEKPEDKSHLPPIPTHYFRVGFSLPGTTLQLGEAKYSYGYESTGKFVTENNFQDYGATFGVGDVVGAYLCIDDKDVTITFTVNGALQPTAITVPRSEFPQENFSLFPHVLCRNYAYELNFGEKEEPWFPHPEELNTYQFLQQIEQKVEGPRRPEKREECEVILMIGLPGSGKTHWVKNHLAANLDTNYTVLGNHPLFDRMTVEGQPIKSRFRGSWKILVDRMQKCLNQLTDQASLRRRNYIIDQTNVFPNAQKRKLCNFEGFNRKAVIIVCDDEEQARRQKDQQFDYGKNVPDTTMYDLKAQMELPHKCDWLEELIFPDLAEEEARQKVKAYNEEANKKGYYKRFPHDRRNPRNFRGARRPFARGGGRFGGRFPPQGGPGWNRPPPAWARKDTHGPPRPFRQGGGGWNQPPRDQNRRDNRNAGGYGGVRNQGGNRNQGGQRVNTWQGNGAGSWGAGGGGHGGWNASMYGSHGYGAWNQQNNTSAQQAAWKYGATQSTYNQGQRGYGASQGYGTQTYGTQAGYGAANNYGQGYGQSWNYYGQYGQQQGWGNQQKKQ